MLSDLRFLLGAILFTLVIGRSHSQDRITLTQAIDIALKNNVQVKQARLNQSLAKENLKYTKIALYPTLNANVGLNFSFGRNEDPFSSEFFTTHLASTSGGMSSNVTLFQWSQKLKQISQNKFLLEASTNNIKKVENDLRLNVMSTYFQILFNEDMLRASKLQLVTARQLLEQEQKQFGIGNKTIVDLSQSKALVSLAELNVSNADNQLQLTYLTFAQLLERDINNEVKVVEIPIEDNLEKLNLYYTGLEVYEKALLRYPTVKIAEYQTLAALKNMEVTRAGLLPRLSLQGGIGTGYSSIRQRAIPTSSGNLQFTKASFKFQVRENLNEYIGIGLSIPLFNGLNSRIVLNRAKINLQLYELTEQLEKNNLKKIINQSILDLKAAEARCNSTLLSYEASLAAYKAIEQRYKVGLVNSVNLTQAQTTMNIAQFELIKAKYELVFKRKIMAFYLEGP